MMNVLQIQDNLKNFSEEQLIKEMQQPSGSAPQFLVLSELNRRKRVKGDLEARQAQQQPTVAEEVVAAAGVPQSGMMGMSEAMAPASVDSGGIGSMMPKTMKMGGEVDSYAEPQSMAEGGVVRAASGLSLADRNLNPGNIRPAGFFGETGANKGYATYASPEFGLRSIAMLSDKYAKDYGIGTVNDFIEKYAPKADKNLNNKAYAKMVADSLGVDPDEQVDFTDDNVKRAIIPAITKFEGYSQDIDPDMLDRAIAGSKETTDESKVNELLSGVDSLSSTQQKNTEKKLSEKDIKDLTDGRGFIDKLFNIIPTPDDSLSGYEGSEKGQIPQFYKDIQKQLEKREENKRKNEGFTESIVGDDFGPALDMYNKKEQDRVDGRSIGQKILDLVPPAEDSPPPPEKKFLFGEKGLDILKENQRKNLLERDLIKQGFYVPEDSLSGFETYDMASPEKATDEVKEETEKVLEKGQTTLPKEKTADSGLSTSTATTSLEQELLKRQSQLQKDRDFDRYMALAQAGLSIMSSDKPTLAGAIGEGGTAGLTAFRDAQKRYQEGLTDILNARVKLANKKTGLTRKEAISAISNIDSTIAKLDETLAKTYDEKTKNNILGRIAQLNYQKRDLMGSAGFDYLPVNVSDSSATKS